MSSADRPARGPSGVRLAGVEKSFGAVRAVRDVSLVIPAGSFFSLLGPSGCGKTTLLRLIAGLETPDAGTISIGDRDVTRLRPQDRPSALVFQNYAIFPHMTVGENVAYGLRVRGVERDTRSRRVESALARVDLSGLQDRPAVQLSGGQQQRVALARAIAVEPDVLLFDEPLSNLDYALREQTRRELKLLQHDLGITSIYVTHDQEEALALSDGVAVMQAGRIVQTAPPEALFEEPATAFVARFLGSNVITRPELASALSGDGAPPGGKLLAVRPDQLAFAGASEGVPAQVLSSQFLGLVRDWWLSAGDERLRLLAPPAQQPDDPVRVRATGWRWVEDDRR